MNKKLSPITVIVILLVVIGIVGFIVLKKTDDIGPPTSRGMPAMGGGGGAKGGDNGKKGAPPDGKGKGDAKIAPTEGKKEATPTKQ